LNHAGKGDSNLSVFLASKKAAIASGTLAEDAIDLEVFKPGFRPPVDAVPSALGGKHCLGLWAELCRDRWGLELRRVLEPGPEPAQAP
jgi:hypothetical protein